METGGEAREEEDEKEGGIEMDRRREDGREGGRGQAEKEAEEDAHSRR